MATQTCSECASPRMIRSDGRVLSRCEHHQELHRQRDVRYLENNAVSLATKRKTNSAVITSRVLRWQQDHPDQLREAQRRYEQSAQGKHIKRMVSASRRARKLNQFIEDVDPDVVYTMHGGMCGICEGFIIGKFHVDHVKPLAKGGMHGYINVQPAHPLCNLVKGDR